MSRGRPRPGRDWGFFRPSGFPAIGCRAMALALLRQILALPDHDRPFPGGGHVSTARPSELCCGAEWPRGLASAASLMGSCACAVSAFVGLWLLRGNDLVARI